ncbi:MAG: M20/M25/M40 family metallo-hydrolase [Deltaproteobacteria bacterium]|nr:M20/M25/M40 family metallo-hydrolase [Deltaproteobacteria bacterium]
MKINVVDEFMALASLNSLSRREGAVAEHLTGRLRELHLDVTIDDSALRTGSDTGNVVVRVPGNSPGPTVLLCAHMDTVGSTEGMVPVLRDGVIYSNGVTVLGADDKAGIAIILSVLADLNGGGVSHPDLEVVFTVQEEVGLFGAKHLKTELRAAFGYILDGDGPVGHIVNQAPSKVDLDLVLTGKAAHAGICPEEGINAIVVAATAIARLRTGRIDRRTTSNVGLISGGSIRNMVADRAEVNLEVRSTDAVRLEEEVQAVLNAFQEEAASAGAGLSVRKDLPFETFTISETHPVVANAFRAARALGIEPRLWTSGGGMDANVFNLQGLPCVGLGIGIEAAHSPQEHIAVAQLEAGVRFIEALLKEAVVSVSPTG